MSRVITAAVLLPFLIASILISWLQPIFVLMAAAAMCFALYEFFVLARKKGIKPDVVGAFLASAALLTIFYFFAAEVAFQLILIQVTLIVLVIGIFVAAIFRGAPFDSMISNLGATLLGVLYIALLGGHLVAIRAGFEQKLSAHLLSFFFLVIMGSDTGAYYAGRAFGKHKLAPKISPGKTWEGVVGGLLAALALAAVSHYWFFRELELKFALPLAAIMTVVGILGDLSESALKRGVGAKDAANILPGHGGLLDRIDSLLFNAPLIYYFARFYFVGDGY